MHSRRAGRVSAAVAVVIMAAGMGSIQLASTAQATNNVVTHAGTTKATTLNTNKVTKLQIQQANRSNYYRTYYLTVVNKETFKQARRKQLAKRSYKKAKKQGRA